MNKKNKLAILGVIGLVLITLSLTYAYWLITRTQTKENIITAGCLDISLSNEQNDISLTEQFPLSDYEGKELTPYTFTVTNNCNTSVDYYLSLEALGDKDTAISASSLKVMVNDYDPTILGDNFEEEPTIADAYASYRLDFGTLAKNGSTDYTLRLWIDEDAPISEMNKSFSSKVSVSAGQGINNPLKEGTLAYDLVSQYGGKNAISMADFDKKEGEWGTTHSGWNQDTYETYQWGTGYGFDKKLGYFLTGTITESSLYECSQGTNNCGAYTLRELPTEGIAYSETIYRFDDFIPESSSLSFVNNYKGLTDYFYEEFDWEESTMDSLVDDYGLSYYIRGDATNNYVQFGTYAKNETVTSLDGDGAEFTFDVVKDNPMYWRIVRINGDGTIRLAYEGPEKIDIKDSIYNFKSSIGLSAISDGNFGFAYKNESGTLVDSPAKDMLDTWYETHLKAGYEKYLADSIFCEDKESAGYITDDLEFVSSSTNAAGTAFKSLKRVLNSNATLSCVQKEDRYTVDDTRGNKYLTHPIGLLNADEWRLGAISHGYGASWTMSPYLKTDVYYYAFSMGEPYPNTEILPIRPVINLKADVLFTGNGSIETPYVITTN